MAAKKHPPKKKAASKKRKVPKNKKSTKIDIAQRRAAIYALLGKGLTPAQICMRTKVSLSTYYTDVGHFREELVDNIIKDAKVMEVLAAREALFKDTLDNVDAAKATMEERSIDSTIGGRNAVSRALKVAQDNLNGLEKTYARLGLVPSEKQTIELEGTLGIDMSTIAHKAAERLKSEKKAK